MIWRHTATVTALIACCISAQSDLAYAKPEVKPSLAKLTFSSHEIDQILKHGPWPPPAARDAGNRLSGQPLAIELGQQLFFDKRLSPDGRMACASCHVAAKAFGDGLARSLGRELLDRNAPSLWNAVHERWQGWDGASDSLWSQAIRPLTDPREMASNAQHISRVIASDPQLACRWKQIFGTSPLADTDATLVNTAKAIAAFNASLVSRPTPFDAFRNSLSRGQRGNTISYPVAAQRGLRIFVGRGQCNACHIGPMFSNGEFGDTGITFFIRQGVVDTGRHGGIVALKASAFNLLSRWSDESVQSSVKTQHVDLQHRNFGEFKVPSLRNVAETSPYMHNGQLATLTDVVRHYSQLNIERLHADGEKILNPLRLTDTEIRDVIAFLNTLSDSQARLWTPKVPNSCRSK